MPAMAAVVQNWTSAQARDAAATIVRTLRDRGFTAYFAGGCVRDELLGFEPVDYDVATDARPDAVQAAFRRTAAVGASFGVVLVKERGVTVEVASFRSDGPYSDKRRPDHVEYSDAEHDARRRDFTINALFLDPLHAGPAVIDFVGGRADLEAKLVRAVGDPEKRLAEDHLRALRAVRFGARYDFAIEPATADAIRRHARALEGVSRERIGDELRRMLAHPSRSRAVGLLADLTLDRVLLGDPGPGTRGRCLAALPDADATFPACLACLAFDRGLILSGAQIPALIRAWRRALCLSNEESDRLREVLAGVLEAESLWQQLPVAQRKRRAASPWFAEALAVLYTRDPARGRTIGDDTRRLGADGVGLAPQPMINGNDLLVLGIPAGPVFARVLASVYDAQLEGRVSEKTDALAMARELAAPGGV